MPGQQIAEDDSRLVVIWAVSQATTCETGNMRAGFGSAFSKALLAAVVLALSGVSPVWKGSTEDPLLLITKQQVQPASSIVV